MLKNDILNLKYTQWVEQKYLVNAYCLRDSMFKVILYVEIVQSN